MPETKIRMVKLIGEPMMIGQVSGAGFDVRHLKFPLMVMKMVDEDNKPVVTFVSVFSGCENPNLMLNTGIKFKTKDLLFGLCAPDPMVLMEYLKVLKDVAEDQENQEETRIIKPSASDTKKVLTTKQ